MNSTAKWNRTDPLLSQLTFDLERILESKRAAYRQRLAALPIVEKLRMLDALRARTLSLRGPSRGTLQGCARVRAPNRDGITRADFLRQHWISFSLGRRIRC